ncbi:MAG: VirB4 family type IV secretion/conjugal transfer ATPase [Inquilinus sp.]|uniref:VirB4 family type IV secretion/conjugal transfer ATPase n=1 Tax=Inquilinus sp. TaxID=1932117 RepID=UPI003F29FB26
MTPSALRRQDPWRPDPIPVLGHVRPDVVALDNGGRMISWWLPGLPFETAETADLNTAHERRNTLWRNIASPRLSLWHHLVRRPDPGYPEGRFRSAFARGLDSRYRGRLAERTLFANDLYLSLVWRPELDPAARALAKIRRPRPPTPAEERAVLAQLDEVAGIIEQFLAAYGPRRLGLDRRGGLLFSEPAEMLYQVAYGEALPVPVVDGHLGASILLNRQIFGHETIELRGPGASRFAGILSVKEYPATTRPGMWDGLLELPFPLVMSQSFVFLDRITALGRITRKQNQMRSAEDKAFSLTEEMTDAQDELMRGAWAKGEHHMTVMPFARDQGQLADRLSAARNALATSALVLAREDIALESAYWAQFPGNGSARTRPAAITTRNFSAFAALHNFPSGRREGNHWGPPLALLATTALTPLHLSLHVRDLGHTFICGRSGSGKTVLQNFAIAMAEKFGARRIFFDYKRGAEIFIRASGGVYLDFRNGVPTGCAPLKALDLSDATDFAFVRKLLRSIAAQGGHPISVADEANLDDALTQLARYAPAERNFGVLLSMLQDNDANGIAARLRRWASGGAYGWVLDNDEDRIRLDHDLTGFDITAFINDPEFGPPLILYLLHRIERALDGRPLVLDIDEAWKALGHPMFAAFGEESLRTFRRLNAVVILGTQEPQDHARLPFGDVIIDQCPTRIFMPDNRATHEVYRAYGLNEEQVRVIREVISPQDKTFLLVQDGSAVVCRLDLGGMDDDLAILSGTEDRSRLLDRIRARLGDDPAAWMPTFLQHYRAPDGFKDGAADDPRS